MKKRKYGEYLNLDSVNAKAFYELKANIQFMCQDNKSKVIMISSAEKNEGRSTTAAYLALVMAQSGKKTILIDCDQKNSNIHNMFNLLNDKGLVNFLTSDIKLESAVKVTKQKNLSIITSGEVTLNNSELFVSANFNNFLKALKEDFDYIVLDTSPLNEGADAKIISRQADGCVLVVKSGKTERKTAAKAKDILRKVGANIIGVFMNQIS